MNTFSPSKKYYPAKPRALGDVVAPLMREAARERSFALVQLMLQWDALVGERIAKLCRPARLSFPRRPKEHDEDKMPEPAVLILRVDKAASLEIQHMADVILSRVNAHFGWPMVGKIVLKAGIIKQPVTSTTVEAQPLDPMIKLRAGVLVGKLEDETLRCALIQLGAKVLSQKAKVQAPHPRAFAPGIMVDGGHGA